MLNRTKYHLMFSCIALALCSFVVAVSLALTVRPSKILDSQNSINGALDANIVNKMISRLELSIKINPWNSNGQLLLGEYFRILAIQQRTLGNNSESNQYFYLSELAYLKAINLQPTWHIAWAKLAALYGELEPNESRKFVGAYTKAMLLGSFEEKSQAILIPLVFQHWNVLLKENKEQIVTMLAHAVKYSNIHFRTSLELAKNDKEKLYLLSQVVSKTWHKQTVKKASEKLMTRSIQ